MKLFKLLNDCPFWPKDEPRDIYRMVKSGTVVSLTGAVAEVLEGEAKGWLRYPIGKSNLQQVSALELLAEASDEEV